MDFVKNKILPYLNDEQKLRNNIISLIDVMPDTFVLSKENPLDNLTIAVKNIIEFYKSMTSMSISSVTGKLALSVKQREAIGQQRRLRTEIYICNTFINTRRKQLQACLTHLEKLNSTHADIKTWLESNPNTLVERQLDFVADGIKSYDNSCTAFNDTITVLDTSVSAVCDFLNDLLPSWDAQISKSEKINKSIEAELKKWD